MFPALSPPQFPMYCNQNYSLLPPLGPLKMSKLFCPCAAACAFDCVHPRTPLLCPHSHRALLAMGPFTSSQLPLPLSLLPHHHCCRRSCWYRDTTSNPSSPQGCNNAPLEVPRMQEHLMPPHRRVWAVSGTAARGGKGVFTPSGQQGPFQLCSVFFLLLYSCST